MHAVLRSQRCCALPYNRIGFRVRCARRYRSEQLLTKSALLVRPPKQETHSDANVRLGARVDHEWYRQEVIKRFIMTLRGNLGLAAHHSREMRILNRVLTWRSSEAGRAGRITYEEDPRHENLLLRDYGVEPGKSRGKTVPRDTPAFLAKNPRSGAHLPADQARSFKS